ncbi:MAG TPA: DUF4424 domain-containing protein [Bauldia sp.]|nr:DUF4424 domain-containing protein [Bauldia sp.]
MRFADRVLLAASASLALFASTALANDSTAALGAGGLNLVRNEEIDLLSEDLYVSEKEIRVTYHFQNHTDEPVTYLVAFPLPAVDTTVPEAAEFVLPDPENDNFVDFEVKVDGKPVTPKIQQRAIAIGVDQSDAIRSKGLSLNPVGEENYARIEKLSQADKEELARLGALIMDANGTYAAWKLETAFYWEQTFPPGKDVLVEHAYRPVIGSGFFSKESLDIEDYKTKYCMDSGFRAAAVKGLDAIAGTDMTYYTEKRISYILTTAMNWASSIKKFRMVIDKGTPESVLSFCGTDVKKIGPTQFEVTETDFYPQTDLDVLIISPPVKDAE